MIGIEIVCIDLKLIFFLFFCVNCYGLIIGFMGGGKMIIL